MTKDELKEAVFKWLENQGLEGSIGDHIADELQEDVDPVEYGADYESDVEDSVRDLVRESRIDEFGEDWYRLSRVEWVSRIEDRIDQNPGNPKAAAAAIYDMLVPGEG